MSPNNTNLLQTPKVGISKTCPATTPSKMLREEEDKENVAPSSKIRRCKRPTDKDALAKIDLAGYRPMRTLRDAVLQCNAVRAWKGEVETDITFKMTKPLPVLNLKMLADLKRQADINGVAMLTASPKLKQRTSNKYVAVKARFMPKSSLDTRIRFVVRKNKTGGNCFKPQQYDEKTKKFRGFPSLSPEAEAKRQSCRKSVTEKEYFKGSDLFFVQEQLARHKRVLSEDMDRIDRIGKKLCLKRAKIDACEEFDQVRSQKLDQKFVLNDSRRKDIHKALQRNEADWKKWNRDMKKKMDTVVVNIEFV